LERTSPTWPCLCADAFAAQDAGVRALAADVQRLLAEDLLVAASALPSQEAAQAAVQHLLGAIVRELGALAGAPLVMHI